MNSTGDVAGSTGPVPEAKTLHILNASDPDLQRRVMEALAHAVDGHAAPPPKLAKRTVDRSS